ncbi:MAG: hypothetical protein P3W87_002300 [Gammaproteobacteria bacterium]|nr:hypothetical protein [Gammaproteobacteria bacterium]
MSARQDEVDPRVRGVASPQRATGGLGRGNLVRGQIAAARESAGFNAGAG